MNRWDEIKATALDVAHHVTQDPAKRNAMADDLITLVGLMINAVGKGVAVDGEADLNDARTAAFPWDDGSFSPTPDDECNAYTRYLTGEALQTQVDLVANEARNADLLRYDRPVWRPRCADCGERNGHAVDCEARCPECNRIEQFGHMFCRLDPTRNSAPRPAVARCGECFRAEGDGHARGCKLAGCVAVHVAHDPRCVGCGEEGCNGSCCISI